MLTKLILVRGRSAVVQYEDEDGVNQAVVVDSEVVASHRVGALQGISEDVVLDGTPYGIDWSIPYPDGIVIPPGDIQNIMYSHGIYTIEDLIKNSNVLVQAINALIRLTSAKVMTQVKDSVGGYK